MKKIVRKILSSFFYALKSVGLAEKANLQPSEKFDDNDFFNPQRRRHIDLVYQFEKAFNANQSIKILDIGCGHGELLHRLKEKGFNDLTGCDWIPPNEVKYGKSFNYTQVDLNNEPVPHSEKYDVIFCSDVMEHLENPSRLLQQISQILKDNGSAYITLPNAFNIFQRLIIFLTGNSSRYRIEKPKEYGHISLMTKNIMTSLCNRHGLTIKDVYGGYLLLSSWMLFPKKRFSPLFSFNICYRIAKSGAK